MFSYLEGYILMKISHLHVIYIIIFTCAINKSFNKLLYFVPNKKSLIENEIFAETHHLHKQYININVNYLLLHCCVKS